MLGENKSNIDQPLKNVLMVSSLKTYKGIFVFLDLAKKMPAYEFSLVAGAPPGEVSDFIDRNFIPHNVKIYSAQPNMHSYYQKAGIIVSLSLPHLCVDTFGLTILEGMAYGLPSNCTSHQRTS